MKLLDKALRVGESRQFKSYAKRVDAINRFEPELRTHDRYGHRVDEVEFHPAWHRLLLGLGGFVLVTRQLQPGSCTPTAPTPFAPSSKP